MHEKKNKENKDQREKERACAFNEWYLSRTATNLAENDLGKAIDARYVLHIRHFPRRCIRHSLSLA